MIQRTYQDQFEAIALAIADSGKPFKLVAAHVFPDMKPASAYARLKACCSAAGDQRLSLGHLLMLMEFCERYDPLYFLCDELGLRRPRKQEPDHEYEDEAVKLVEVINHAADTMNRAMRAMEQLKARGGIRAVA